MSCGEEEYKSIVEVGDWVEYVSVRFMLVNGNLTGKNTLTVSPELQDKS